MTLMSSRPQNAYQKLLLDCISAAQIVDASDIHISPAKDGAEIKFRVHGEMQPPWKVVAQRHKCGLLADAKRLFGLDIGIARKTQDGRKSFDEKKLDLRASLLPTLYGEKIVLRLLAQGKSFSLDKLGIENDAFQAIERATQFESGLILVSGPTGSGKTHTLYSILASINREKKNILTLENPVEYTLAGISQVDISKELSFADGLRAALRQDPDVILVGEVRDVETADLCIKASSTGHLVLSTIHANGAMEAVNRLVKLGIDEKIVVENLRLSVAQRLAKILCQNCKISTEDGRVSQGSGCGHCFGGVRTRMPVVEFVGTQEIAEGLGPKIPLKKRFEFLSENKMVDFREVERFA